MNSTSELIESPLEKQNNQQTDSVFSEHQDENLSPYFQIMMLLHVDVGLLSLLLVLA
jgi:hypothetical protein